MACLEKAGGRGELMHTSAPVYTQRGPVFKSLDPDLPLSVDLCQRERLPMTMYLPEP